MFPYQLALSEYDFTIANLFGDLQDGIILCRVVQLLLSDASIILVCIYLPPHELGAYFHWIYSRIMLYFRK